jgi:RHS repeat-associated protein
VTFWSPSGQKLGTYALTAIAQTYTGGVYSGPYFYATQTGTNTYFGGKLIRNSSGWVYSDRLGSIGKYYPYGQERPSATTNGTEKFATYFRDSETGLDYAINRYQQPGTGRYLTTDPARAADPRDPNSWNQYSYTNDDPVNRVDADGLMAENICGIDSSAFGYEPFAGYWEQLGLCETTWGDTSLTAAATTAVAAAVVVVVTAAVVDMRRRRLRCLRIFLHVRRLSDSRRVPLLPSLTVSTRCLLNTRAISVSQPT